MDIGNGVGVVKGFREVIQDLLVPELKAIKVELQHHSEQFRKIDERFEKIDERFEKIFVELEDLKIGQREILAKFDLNKRLMKVETILKSEGKSPLLVRDRGSGKR
ncbi:MAG: hypothetical protein AB1633_00020 [Elusimicrobiota bacterium]